MLIRVRGGSGIEVDIDQRQIYPVYHSAYIGRSQLSLARPKFRDARPESA